MYLKGDPKISDFNLFGGYFRNPKFFFYAKIYHSLKKDLRYSWSCRWAVFWKDESGEDRIATAASAIRPIVPGKVAGGGCASPHSHST